MKTIYNDITKQVETWRTREEYNELRMRTSRHFLPDLFPDFFALPEIPGLEEENARLRQGTRGLGRSARGAGDRSGGRSRRANRLRRRHLPAGSPAPTDQQRSKRCGAHLDEVATGGVGISSLAHEVPPPWQRANPGSPQ